MLFLLWLVFADVSVAPRADRIIKLQLHAMEGPFRSLEDYRAKVWYRESPTVHYADGQHVDRQRSDGWYVDPNVIEFYWCTGNVELPPQWVVQFFDCDVDPPDGTFYFQLRGVVICEQTSCSDFVPLEGYSAQGEEHASAPMRRISRRELVIAGHHLKF
jgi:hypothetical protein